MNAQNSTQTPIEQSHSGLFRMLTATRKLAPSAVVYAAVLGVLSLATSSDLSTTLSLLVSGVTINAISELMKRLEQGEGISDDAIYSEVQSAIEKSHIQEKLFTNNDALVMLGGLFRRFDLLGYAVTDNGRAIQEQLTELAAKYDGLMNGLNEGISEIHSEISEIKEPIDQILGFLQSGGHVASNSLESQLRHFQSGQTPQFVKAGRSSSVSIPDVINFVGRDSEISEIDELIKQRRLLVILGPVGIGKSALLYQLARKWRDEGKHTLLYTFAPISSVQDLINQFALFLDIEQGRQLYLPLLHSSYSAQQKLDLLIEGLSQLDPVLCFDEYHRVEENSETNHVMNYLARNLKHGSIVVTSRHRPNFDTMARWITSEMIEYPLMGLTENEVKQFLVQFGVSFLDDLSKFIAHDLGGLPIALRLVHSLVNVGYDIAMLAGNLRERVGRPVLDYLFEELWRHLDAGQKEILTLGSLFYLPFTASALIRLSSNKQVREQLTVLEKQGLLHRIGANFYLEYEAVKFLALSFCDDVIVERGTIASRLINPEPDYMDAYIESAMQFYKIGKYNNAAQIITDYLVDAQIPTHYQSILDMLLSKLNEEKYNSGELDEEQWLWLRNAKGQSFSLHHQWERAEIEYKDMLRLAQGRSDKMAISVALQNIGVNYQLAEDYQAKGSAEMRKTLAEQYYRDSLTIKKDIDDLWGQAQIHGNLGNIYLDREDFALAQREFDQQVALLEEAEVDDWHFLPVHANHGRLFGEQGQHFKAIEAYSHALSIAEKHHLMADIAKLNHNLGHAYQDMGDDAKAIEFFDKAHRTASEIGFLEIQDNSAIGLGQIYHGLGQFEKSIEYFEEAGQMRNELGDFAGLASIYFDISTFYYLRNNAERAREFALKGLELFDHITAESQIDLYAHNTYQIIRKAGMLEIGRQQFKALRRRILKREGYSSYPLAKTYEVLGFVYLDLANVRAANWCFVQSVCLLQGTSAEDHAQHMSTIGGKYEEAEKYTQALNWYSKALQAAKEGGLRRIESGMLYNLGNVHAALLHWEDAATYYSESQKIAQEINDLELNELISHNLGFVAREQGDLEGAIALLSRSLELSRNRGDMNSVVATLNNLGIAYHDNDQIQAAIDCFNEGISICRISKLKSLEADVLISLGNVFLDENHFDTAESQYRDSLQISREIGDWDKEESAVLSLGNLFHRKGDFAPIEELFQETGQKSSDLGRYSQLTDFLILASEVALSRGDFENAAHNFEQSIIVGFAAGGGRMVDNSELAGPEFFKELEHVWSRLLLAFKYLLDTEQRMEAIGFCDNLMQELNQDSVFQALSGRGLIHLPLERIRNYLLTESQPSIEGLLDLIE